MTRAAEAGGSQVTLASSPRLTHRVDESDTDTIAPRRRSACAEASFLAELERLKRMTIEERVKAALAIPDRFAWLDSAAPTQTPISPGKPKGKRP